MKQLRSRPYYVMAPRAFVIFAVLLSVHLYMYLWCLSSENEKGNRVDTDLRLEEIEALRAELDELYITNWQLNAQLLDLNDKLAVQNEKDPRRSVSKAPTKEYEHSRHRIYLNIQEYWYRIHRSFSFQQRKVNDNNKDRIAKMITMIDEQYIILLRDISNLAEIDGYSTWRTRESRELSDLVQNKIKQIQNPPSCDNARKLVCQLFKNDCGYGCRLHHVVNCLIFAFDTNTTLVLNEPIERAELENLFLPLSGKCRLADGYTLSKCTVHVRRGDKIGRESSFYRLEEYMYHIELYYKINGFDGRVDKKRIYLATDEQTLFGEAKLKYPEYEIIGDPLIPKFASITDREKDDSIMNINIDIHFLSLCDYIVCTFSSNVGRAAYEIMNSLHPDASLRYTTLDETYNYARQIRMIDSVVVRHDAHGSEEMGIEVGDEVLEIENLWNGFSRGTNLRTNITGTYPTFKVTRKVETSNFSSHPYINIEQCISNDTYPIF